MSKISRRLTRRFTPFPFRNLLSDPRTSPPPPPLWPWIIEERPSRGSVFPRANPPFFSSLREDFLGPLFFSSSARDVAYDQGLSVSSRAWQSLSLVPLFFLPKPWMRRVVLSSRVLLLVPFFLPPPSPLRDRVSPPRPACP